MITEINRWGLFYYLVFPFCEVSVNSKYMFADIDLSDIRNRNELRVIQGLERLAARRSCALLLAKDWQDIYALALNMLPARYTQSGSIVLGDIVRDIDVDECVEAAHNRVVENPKP